MLGMVEYVQRKDYMKLRQPVLAAECRGHRGRE